MSAIRVSISIAIITSVVKRTRDENVAIMSDKVLDDFRRAVLDIDIAPVDPAVFRLHGSTEEVISGLAHGLSTRTLGSETVSVLDVLAQMDAEIFLHNGDTVEGDRVCAGLDALELFGQNGKSIIGAVADEESEVDEVVRVCQLRDQVEIIVDVGSGIAQRSEKENALLVVNGLSCALDGIEIDAVDGGVVDLDGGVVVEDDGCLQAPRPQHLLVRCHLHWRFGGTETVEPAMSACLSL